MLSAPGGQREQAELEDVPANDNNQVWMRKRSEAHVRIMRRMKARKESETSEGVKFRTQSKMMRE
jgi:hypothetical protein